MSILEPTPDHALLWLDYAEQFDSGGSRVIRNWGKAGSAPKNVINGNGTSATTFATQLVGQKGVFFAGLIAAQGKYIDTGIVDKFTASTPFTVACVTSAIPSTAPEGTQSLFGNYNASTDTGIVSYLNSGATILYFIFLQNPGNYKRQVSTPITPQLMKRYNSFIFTYSGNGVADATGMNIYINGNLAPGTYITNSTFPAINNGKAIMLGGLPTNTVPGTYAMIGNQHHTSIFPFELSQLQVKTLHNQIMRSIKV
jgi:hypothetical protein